MREREFYEAIGDWSAPLPHPRMSVYRNNVAGALAAALKVRFPVTEQLVGAAFFAAMARAYAEAERPASPVLISYGESFADFIRGFAPAASVAYLGDVAALENLWWKAYHAREAEPLQATALAAVAPDDLGGLKLALHPSAGLLSSPYAIADIWQAHRGGPGMGEISLDAPQSVLVARPAADVSIRVIAPASLAFLASLGQGASLADAMEQTAAAFPDFDVAAQIGGAFGLGLITGYRA